MNTPNKITLSRLLLIPLIVFFYLADFVPFGKLIGTVLFVIACLTDFLDGYLARKNNQVTLLGKFFDSIADKVLIATGLLLIVYPGGQTFPAVYPSWLGLICVIIILAREFIVSALRQVAAAKGKVLAADMGGKIKATAQYVVVTLYMVLAFVQEEFLPTAVLDDYWIAAVRFVLMVLLIGATLLTIYSGASYLIRNRHVFKESQQDDKQSTQTEKTSKPKKSVEANKEVVNNGKINCQEIDPLFYEAVMYFIQTQQPSSTSLQRQFTMGYPRASRLVKTMESLGLISQLGEDNKRKMLVTKEQFDKMI